MRPPPGLRRDSRHHAALQAALNGTLNPTRYATEQAAYGVNSFIAQARSASGAQTIFTVGPGKYEIWNSGFFDPSSMFNSAFDALTDNADDYYPEPLRGEIDAINTLVYDNVNNGVYRAGFATTKPAYETAFHKLFETLDSLETTLETQRYLVGSKITEADWRLFATLIRFDAVYVSHFKCNLRRIADYPNLSNYVRELYQWPGIAGTVNMAHIKQHYFGSHPMINPTLIVPIGPELDFTSPHNRDRMK